MTDSVQAGMFDVTLEDPELEDALATILDAKEFLKEINRARRVRKERLAQHPKLKEGQRVRVGGIAFTYRTRERDKEVSIPPWKTGSATQLEILSM